MNIVKRELRANLKSMLIFIGALAFLIGVWMIEYKSFANSPEMAKLLAAFPQGLLAALGLQDMSLTSLNGFIGSISLYIYLLLAIQAALLGSYIISKEESNKTAEFLYCMPVTRLRVIFTKTIAAIIMIISLNLTTLSSMLISTLTYEKTPDFYKFITLIFLSSFIISMIFLSIGMAISAISKTHKKSQNITIAILMTTFSISSLIAMIKSLEIFKFLSPFSYFKSSDIINNLSLSPIYLTISALIIICGLTITFTIYPKKDICV